MTKTPRTLLQVLEEQGFERDTDGSWEYGFTGTTNERVTTGTGVSDWVFTDCLTGATVAGAGVSELRSFLIERGV